MDVDDARHGAVWWCDDDNDKRKKGVERGKRTLFVFVYFFGGIGDDWSENISISPYFGQ